MNPSHVLFIGLGGVGQRHLRNVRAQLGRDVRVSAYRVRREMTLLSDTLTAIEGGNLEEEYGVDVFDDLGRALAEKPDCAIIANPSSLHVPVAREALRAGCDLFIEKPLSHDLDGVVELVAEAKARNRIGFVAYQLRFHPAVRALIEAVDSEKCGVLYGASAEVSEYLPNFHPFEDYRRMYASRKDLGGGVTLTQIHEIDLLYRLFGIPERVWSVGGKVSDLEIDVEDTASSLLHFRRADGMPLAVSLHQDYLGRPPRRSLQVWGSEGRLALDLRAGCLDFIPVTGNDKRLVDASSHPRNQLFSDELEHFFTCMKTRETPDISLEDGAASLGIAMALLESQRTGCVVPPAYQRALAA